MTANTERVEIRLSSELIALAERAAFISGCSLTDYLAELVRKDAPNRLRAHNEIVLPNERFDKSIQASEKANPAQKAILDAAERLDREGF